MKVKIIFWTLSLVFIALLGAIFYQYKSATPAAPKAHVTLSNADFSTLGLEPDHWQEDLGDLVTLFEAFTVIDTTQTATQQVASIPPELKVLGSSLQQMRAQAEANKDKAQELAKVLNQESKKAHQFLPIRALAYTHLKLLSRAQEVLIDETAISEEVKALSQMVLAPSHE